MSYLSPQKDENICIRCCYKNAPYINPKWGTYSPCIKCKDNSNYKINKRLKINRDLKL